MTLTAGARADKDATGAVVLLDVDAGLAGKVYLDDFSVVVKEAEPEPAPKPIPSGEDKTEVAVVTDQPEDNLTPNPGFELENEGKGHEMGWGVVNGATINTDTDYAHSGAYSVVCEDDPLGSSVFSVLPNSQDANAATTVSAWVYLEYPADADKVSLRLKRIDAEGADVVVYTAEDFTAANAKAGWQMITLEVPERTQADSAQLVIVVDVAAGAKGRVFLDDFYVETVKKAPAYPDGFLTNPGLDRVNEGATEVNNWGLMPGWDKVPGAVCSDVVHTAGGHSVKIDQVGEQRELIQSANWIDPNTTKEVDTSKPLLLTVWVKYEDITGDGIWLRSERKTGNTAVTAQSRHLTGSSNGWEKLELYIAPNDGDFDEYILGLAVAPGSGTVWVDDFYLTKTDHNDPLDNYIANWSFEQKDGGREKWGAIPGWGNGLDVVSGEGHNRERALRMTLSENDTLTLFQSNSWGGVQKYRADQNMILSVFLRTSGITGDGALLKAERKNGDELVGEPLLSERVTGSWNGWTLLELYIPATNEPVDDIIVTLEVAPGTGVLYADSWGLYPTDLPAPAGSASAGEEESDGALLKNGDVEQLNPDGTVTHWDVWPGNPEEGQRNSYSTTEFKHSGERSVCIELVYSNPQAIYQYRLPEDNAFDFNGDYIFSAWVKMDGVSVLDGNGVKIGVKRKGADGNEYNVYQSVPMGTCDWTKVELEVPKEPGVNIVQYDVIFDIGCGTGKIYFDDFELTPAELTATGPEFAFREVKFTAADLLPAAGAASGFAARDIALLGASGVCLIVAAALGGTATIRFKKTPQRLSTRAAPQTRQAAGRAPENGGPPGFSVPRRPV